MVLHRMEERRNSVTKRSDGLEVEASCFSTFHLRFTQPELRLTLSRKKGINLAEYPTQNFPPTLLTCIKSDKTDKAGGKTNFLAMSKEVSVPPYARSLLQTSLERNLNHAREG